MKMIKTKAAAALVAALMVFAVLPAGAHDLPDSVEVDGETYEEGTPLPAVVGGSIRTTAPNVRYFEVDPDGDPATDDRVVIDHHGRHAGGTDDCTVWLGGFPGWTGEGRSGYKPHNPPSFGLVDVTDDPDTPADETYDAQATWEGLSHPRADIPSTDTDEGDWCYEGYLTDQRTTTTPSASSATRGGVAQERETARHGNPSAYRVFYCSDGVEQRRGAAATSGCLVLISGRWNAGASVQFVTGSYRGFVYTLS